MSLAACDTNTAHFVLSASAPTDTQPKRLETGANCSLSDIKPPANSQSALSSGRTQRSSSAQQSGSSERPLSQHKIVCELLQRG